MPDITCSRCGQPYDKAEHPMGAMGGHSPDQCIGALRKRNAFLEDLGRTLVGEEALDQDGQYETEMTTLHKDNQRLQDRLANMRDTLDKYPGLLPWLRDLSSPTTLFRGENVQPFCDALASLCGALDLVSISDLEKPIAWVGRPELEPKTLDEKFGYIVEECGEALTAIGKTMRRGLEGYDPTITAATRETNRDWILRELKDVVRAARIMRIELSEAS